MSGEEGVSYRAGNQSPLLLLPLTVKVQLHPRRRHELLQKLYLERESECVCGILLPFHVRSRLEMCCGSGYDETTDSILPFSSSSFLSALILGSFVRSVLFFMKGDFGGIHRMSL